MRPDRSGELFLLAWNSLGKEGMEPEPEFQFHPSRRWRFDSAWPAVKVALEIEGGVYTKGRHTRIKGFLGDMEKYNEATLAGWSVLRTTPDAIRDDPSGVVGMITKMLRRNRRKAS